MLEVGERAHLGAGHGVGLGDGRLDWLAFRLIEFDNDVVSILHLSHRQLRGGSSSFVALATLAIDRRVRVELGVLRMLQLVLRHLLSDHLEDRMLVSSHGGILGQVLHVLALVHFLLLLPHHRRRHRRGVDDALDVLEVDGLLAVHHFCLFDLLLWIWITQGVHPEGS